VRYEHEKQSTVQKGHEYWATSEGENPDGETGNWGGKSSSWGENIGSRRKGEGTSNPHGISVILSKAKAKNRAGTSEETARTCEYALGRQRKRRGREVGKEGKFPEDLLPLLGRPTTQRKEERKN